MIEKKAILTCWWPRQSGTGVEFEHRRIWGPGVWTGERTWTWQQGILWAQTALPPPPPSGACAPRVNKPNVHEAVLIRLTHVLASLFRRSMLWADTSHSTFSATSLRWAAASTSLPALATPQPSAHAGAGPGGGGVVNTSAREHCDETKVRLQRCELPMGDKKRKMTTGNYLQ